MTVPTPDLPYTLAHEVGHDPVRIIDYDPIGDTVCVEINDTATWIDAVAMRTNLNHFIGVKTIPAEARKVIADALGKAVDTVPPDESDYELADQCLAALAAAGLLVGPGEPAASEGEPWGWADRDGRGWRRGEDGDLYYRSNTISSTYEAVERNQGPLTALYARPPVTAEPATAPSVEQIAEALGNTDSIMVDQIAEEIRALWSPAPGDAAEEPYETPAELAARVRVLETEVIDWQLSRDRAEIARSNVAAENERLRAALEAAKKHLVALHRRFEAERGQWAAENNVFHRTRDAAQTYQAWDAARAAVEADTTEEA